jgi:DEAD/DEAH box helicase domain-containing protein
LVDGHFRVSDRGFLAECHLQITERVEGFEERGNKRLYQDLRQNNPNLTPKTRDFRTTGVVIQIREDWFSGNKRLLADVLHALLLREFSISSADVDFAATNISLVRDGQRHAATDVIAIFDSTHGSLRLSEPLYTKLDLILERLQKAVSMTPKENDLIPEELVDALRLWYASLGPDSADSFASLATLEVPGGVWIQVFKRGSIVAKRDQQNVLRDIEIIEPEMVTIDGPPRLFYRYVVNGGSALVSSDVVEAVGDSWSMQYWNPDKGEFKDIAEELVVPQDRPISLEDSVTPTES